MVMWATVGIELRDGDCCMVKACEVFIAVYVTDVCFAVVRVTRQEDISERQQLVGHAGA